MPEDSWPGGWRPATPREGARLVFALSPLGVHVTNLVGVPGQREAFWGTGGDQEEELLQLPNQYFPYVRLKIAQPRICLQPADTPQLLAVSVTKPLGFATYRCWACGFPFSALVSCQLLRGLLRLHVHSLSLCLPVLRLCSPGSCCHWHPGSWNRLPGWSSGRETPLGPILGGEPQGSVCLCRNHCPKARDALFLPCISSLLMLFFLWKY